MIVELPNGQKAKLIGDPHLGANFDDRPGFHVPIHRRGEREAKQLKKFIDNLNTPDVDYNIMVGDLFEHPYVAHRVVVRAAEAYLAAALANPDTTFIAMAGNHDRPREIDRVGAWDAFSLMIGDALKNLWAVDRPDVWQEFILLPWEWNRSSAEQIEWLDMKYGHLLESYPRKVCIGHHDLKSYGGDDSHLYPTKELEALGVTEFYSGHYHTPGDYVVAGHTVRCTGSLEPYSHGEDPDEEIYVTVSRAEVEARPEDFKDKCVRVILAPGEDLPTDLDCLAISSMRTQHEAVEIPEINSSEFDWEETLNTELATVDDEEVVTFIRERL